MASISFEDVVGAVTGSSAAKAKLTDYALSQRSGLEDSLKNKLAIAGKPLGEIFGSGIFDALAGGAREGEAVKVDQVTQEKTGFTWSAIKQAAPWIIVPVIALPVLGFLWLLRRAKIV